MEEGYSEREDTRREDQVSPYKYCIGLSKVSREVQGHSPNSELSSRVVGSAQEGEKTGERW